jgi:hypothetical protein
MGWSYLDWAVPSQDREQWRAVVIANVPSGGSTNCWEFLDKLYNHHRFYTEYLYFYLTHLSLSLKVHTRRHVSALSGHHQTLL